MLEEDAGGGRRVGVAAVRRGGRRRGVGAGVGCGEGRAEPQPPAQRGSRTVRFDRRQGEGGGAVDACGVHLLCGEGATAVVPLAATRLAVHASAVPAAAATTTNAAGGLGRCFADGVRRRGGGVGVALERII